MANGQAPAFDPNQPYQVVSQAAPPASSQSAPAGSDAPAFDPNQPYQVVSQAEPQTTPDQPGILSRALTGAGQGMQEVTAPVTPQDHKEALVSFLGGPGALVAYKAGKSVVSAVENIVKPPKDNAPEASGYQRAVQDFHNTIKEFRNKDYRNAGSSAVSTGADLLSTMPGPGAFIGPQVRDVAEGCSTNTLRSFCIHATLSNIE
jgi:hypothetical protein